jgi:hypothetical protein
VEKDGGEEEERELRRADRGGGAVRDAASLRAYVRACLVEPSNLQTLKAV